MYLGKGQMVTCINNLLGPEYGVEGYLDRFVFMLSIHPENIKSVGCYST